MTNTISKQDYIKPFQLTHLRTWVRNFNNELYESILNKVTPVKSGVVIPKVELRTIMPNDLNRSIQLAKVTFTINDDTKKPTIENCLEEHSEKICDNCEFNNYNLVSHPGGSSYHSVKKHYCEQGFWEDDF